MSTSCSVSFFSDDIKKDAATTTPNSKRSVELLKERKLLASSLSTIWENTDGCAEQYKCSSALYIMSVIFQCYSVIIYCGISAPVHVKGVFNGLNAIDKLYIYQLMSNVQLPG